jgi:hypothetical protein
MQTTTQETPIIYSSSFRTELRDTMKEKCKNKIPLQIKRSSNHDIYKFTIFHQKEMKSLHLNLHIYENGYVFVSDSLNPTISHTIQLPNEGHPLTTKHILRIVLTMRMMKKYLKEYVTCTRSTSFSEIFYVFSNSGMTELDISMMQMHKGREYEVFNMMDEFTLDIQNPDGPIYFYIDF